MKTAKTASGLSNPHVNNVNELKSILPARTRGAMAVDIGRLLVGDSSSEVADLLYGRGTDIALNKPFSNITTFSLGIDIQDAMETVLMVHTTHVQQGLILMSKLSSSLLSEVINVGTLKEGLIYKTHTIYTEPLSGLNLTLLPKSVLIVGQIDSIKSIIDVYEGDADNAEASAAVGSYLGDLVSGHSLTFVYGLPGLYRNIPDSLTLNGSHAISSQLEFSNGMLHGEVSFYTDNAENFASAFNEATASCNRLPVKAYPAVSGQVERLVIPVTESKINKSADEIISSRHPLKMLFYIMEAKQIAGGIASGATHPCKNFFVDAYPPSIFINYEIPEEQVAAFSTAFVPTGFEMIKLRLLESDHSAYFLSLNIYKTRGLAAGIRYEWSIFVKDPAQEKPRFLVIHALAELRSLDPSSEDFFTPPQPVTHIDENGQLISKALQDQGNGMEDYFLSTIKWPQDSPQVDRTTREFIVANDFIYWEGGVYDHCLYTGSMHNRDVTIIPPSDYTVKDNTPFAVYIKPVPSSVFVYQNDLDYLFLPWENLETDDLDMVPDRIEALRLLKRKLYSKLINNDVVAAFNAKDEPVSAFEIDNSVPSVFFNYVIPDAKADGLEAALGLPSGYCLKKNKILESDAQQAYYLTLNIFKINEAIEGLRAEWSVYVDDGTGHEHFMIVELMTEDVVLDPVNLLNFPSMVQHELSGDTVSTTLVSPTIDFKAVLKVNDCREELHTLDWVEAKDFVYYLNGICDKYYFGEGSLETPLLLVNPSSVIVSASTPWSEFIDSEPVHVLLRTNRQFIGKKPWVNVQPENIPEE
jgi:hypothetical protein